MRGTLEAKGVLAPLPASLQTGPSAGCSLPHPHLFRPGSDQVWLPGPHGELLSPVSLPEAGWVPQVRTGTRCPHPAVETAL